MRWVLSGAVKLVKTSTSRSQGPTMFSRAKDGRSSSKIQRIVQHGTQCRSSANIIEGIQKLHEGIIGEVYFARGIAYKVRPSHGKHEPKPAPSGLNWDAWCGPAPLNEYSTFKQKKWHWIWDFGNGEIGNQGVHQMDILRWGLKLDSHPETISSMGTNYIQEKVHKSDAQTRGFSQPCLNGLTAKWSSLKSAIGTPMLSWFSRQVSLCAKGFPRWSDLLGE